MMMKRRTFGRGVLVGIVLVLLARYVIDASPFADWLVAPLLLTDTTEPVDAIVVAGAGLVGPCEPNLSAVRRVLRAAALWERQRDAFVLFTGGPPRDLSCAVADVMAELAVKAGIPQERILTEATSGNTRENAYYASPVLDAVGARRIVLVTDRLHMRRASQSFAAHGYTVGRSSVPVYATHRGNVDMLASAAREFAALAYYWSRGWLDDEGDRNGVERTAAAPPPGPSGAPPGSAGPLIVLGASYAAGWPLESVAGLRVVNKGMAGEESFVMAGRFDRDVLAHAPRAVVLWGFINDVFRSPRPEIEATLARARDSFTAMIARGRAAGIDVILATEVPVTGQAGLTNRLMGIVGGLLRRPSYQDYINGHVQATNAWLRETARREGLLLLDLERVVSAPGGERRRAFAQPDGSHLTEAAYAAISRYSVPVLERHFAARR